MGACQRVAPLDLIPVLAWSDAMTEDLALIREDAGGPEYYRQLFEMRDVGGYEVRAAGARVGTVLYRLDQTEYGREFVIVAAACSAGEASVTDDLFAELEQRALMLGAPCVRFHTRRRGLIKRAGGNGYAISEIVLRKALANGGEALH